jgi:hypothetical protein
MSTEDIINHPLTRGHIKSMSVHELRELCRSRHYPIHGDRLDLLGRIFNSLGPKSTRQVRCRQCVANRGHVSGWTSLLLVLFFITISYYQQPEQNTITDPGTPNYIPVSAPSPSEFPVSSHQPVVTPPTTPSFTEYIISYTTS